MTDDRPAPLPGATNSGNDIGEELELRDSDELIFQDAEDGCCFQEGNEELCPDTTPNECHPQDDDMTGQPGDPSALNNCDLYQAEITDHTTALRRCLPEQKDKEMQLLVARSKAYCNFSRCLRLVPASNSERRALYAPDPLQLATKALCDAEGALRHASGFFSQAQLAKAEALFTLERYTEARDAYCIVMQVNPQEIVAAERLACCEEVLSETPSFKAKKPCFGPAETALPAPCAEARERLIQDFECSLCLKVLYEPVTTPCGHTFCQPCYARATDHMNKCPMCRTVLHVGRKLPVTIFLKNLLEKHFPEEYAARRDEETVAAAGALHPEVASPLPLFVMSVVLPGERIALNVFEPRYRLMIRRVMEGNRRFGMAVVDRSHHLASVVTEVEVVECEPMPDGRFLLEIVGKRRFRPNSPGEQDGYRIAVPEFFGDEPVEPGSAEAAELDATSLEVEAMAVSWAERLRNLGQSRGSALELLRRAGEKPPRTDYEKFSFWVGNLICPVLDHTSIKFRLLGTSSTLERMEQLRSVLQQVRDAQISSGCSIM